MPAADRFAPAAIPHRRRRTVSRFLFRVAAGNISLPSFAPYMLGAEQRGSPDEYHLHLVWRREARSPLASRRRCHRSFAPCARGRRTGQIGRTRGHLGQPAPGARGARTPRGGVRWKPTRSSSSSSACCRSGCADGALNPLSGTRLDRPARGGPAGLPRVGPPRRYRSMPQGIPRGGGRTFWPAVGQCAAECPENGLHSAAASHEAFHQGDAVEVRRTR